MFIDRVFYISLRVNSPWGGIQLIDLYIDITSGVSVTELINSIVSSGFIQMDSLIELLNDKFGSIAKFSYQSMHQDGVDKTNLHVKGHITATSQEEQDGYLYRRINDYGNQINSDMNVNESLLINKFSGDRRSDEVRSLNLTRRITAVDLEKLSERWPARVQLIGAALYTLLRTYDIGRIFVIDDVQLSNGMSYNLNDAWTHRNFLVPDECAALGALIAHGEAVSREEFFKVVGRPQDEDNERSVRKLENVYFTGHKDKLYKLDTTRYNEYRNNMTNK